jgi:hypothetical protein
LPAFVRLQPNTPPGCRIDNRASDILRIFRIRIVREHPLTDAEILNATS